MAREKAPAFQFYPRDFLADANVQAMTMEERGLYIWLLAHCWLEQSIPMDEARLARLCGMPRARLRRLWPALAPCFLVSDDGYRQKRLDVERQKQSDCMANRSQAGSKGADKRWHSHALANGKPIANDSSSSSSSSASSVQTPVASVARAERTPPLVSMREHRSHALCGRICLPAFLFDKLVRQRGGPEDEARDYVRVWAARVIDAWNDGGVHGADTVGESDLAYWQARWSEDHPSTRAPLTKSSGNRAALAAYIATLEDPPDDRR